MIGRFSYLGCNSGIFPTQTAIWMGLGCEVGAEGWPPVHVAQVYLTLWSWNIRFSYRIAAPFRRERVCYFNWTRHKLQPKEHWELLVHMSPLLQPPARIWYFMYAPVPGLWNLIGKFAVSLSQFQVPSVRVERLSNAENRYFNELSDSNLYVQSSGWSVGLRNWQYLQPWNINTCIKTAEAYSYIFNWNFTHNIYHSYY